MDILSISAIGVFTVDDLIALRGIWGWYSSRIYLKSPKVVTYDLAKSVYPDLIAISVEKYNRAISRLVLNGVLTQEHWPGPNWDKMQDACRFKKNIRNSQYIISINKPISERRQLFYAEVQPYTKQYGEEMIKEFYDHWTLESRLKPGFMNFEIKDFFDTGKRLANWLKNRQSGMQRTTYNMNK